MHSQKAPYTVVKGALDDVRLQRLREYLNEQKFRDAVDGEGWDPEELEEVRQQERNCQVSWFDMELECPWLFESIYSLVRDVGNARWSLLRCDDSGSLQLKFEDTCACIYNPGEHFAAWHTDAEEGGEDDVDGRRIAIVVMLSKPADYTGGCFEVLETSGATHAVDLDAGDAVVFPAGRLEHRVAPVEIGVRRSIVFWAYEKDWVPALTFL